MKQKIHSRDAAILVVVVAVTMLLSSCGLLVSKKRTLKSQVVVYQNLLTNSDFLKAGRMCHKSRFTWIKPDGEKQRGVAAIKAFHDSIAAVSSRTGVEIYIAKITETKKGKTFVVAGYILVKQSDSTSLRSVKINCAMTWATNGKEWRIMQIKETSPRKRAHS